MRGKEAGESKGIDARAVETSSERVDRRRVHVQVREHRPTSHSLYYRYRARFRRRRLTKRDPTRPRADDNGQWLWQPPPLCRATRSPASVHVAMCGNLGSAEAGATRRLAEAFSSR